MYEERRFSHVGPIDIARAGADHEFVSDQLLDAIRIGQENIHRPMCGGGIVVVGGDLVKASPEAREG